MPKVLIAAGGTGGHLFPAQNFAKNLLEKKPNIDIHFAAKGLSENQRYLKEFPFSDISSATLKKNPLSWPKTGWELCSGVWQSFQLLRKLKPDLLVGFGSYHTATLTAAAALLGVPFVLFESNSTPGRVIRLFSKRARWTGIYFPNVEQELQGHVRLVEIPHRKEFLEAKRPNRKEAAAYYGLHPDKKTLLVFGGSQGAKGINQLIQGAHPLIQTKDLQILHFTGEEGSTHSYPNGCVKPFEKKMEMAYALSDLVISRSGAATIAELQLFQLPSIFIPFPHAADNHQEKNARFVENTLGSALVIKEADCTAERLGAQVDRYFATGFQNKNPLLTSTRLDFTDQVLKEVYHDS